MSEEAVAETSDFTSLRETAGKLVSRACEVLCALWGKPDGTFWRSTAQRARQLDKTEQFFPTVTFRSVEALLEVISDRPEWIPQHLVDLVLAECLPRILSREEAQMKSALGAGPQGRPLNSFTLSLYIQMLGEVRASPAATAVQTLAAERLDGAGRQLLEMVSLEADDAAHPFLLFHLLRALRTLTRMSALGPQAETAAEAVLLTIRRQARELLAEAALAGFSPSDAVAAAFCAGALATSPRPEDLRYAKAAASVSLRAQDGAGWWPLGRVVGENKDLESARPEIPTYEVAWALTEAALAFRRDADWPVTPGLNLANGLQKAIRHAASSVVRLNADTEPTVGWCTDHAYGRPLVESWTSATVLKFALAFAAFVEAEQHSVAIRQFTTLDPLAPDWPTWLKWSDYKLAAVPDIARPILTYLDERLVSRIRGSARNLPSPADRTVSVLLFGPPGTQKTTIVKGIAHGLGWPLVQLSPGSFIDLGLEAIENRARRVFTLLHQLSRAVVLFDECDELFRTREPLPQVEQVRAITAFVTASMLPKLQNLHDFGRVVFFICTNSLASMDPAVTRGGRVDHVIGVGPPDENARRAIIAANGRLSEGAAMEAATELAAKTDRFTRSEVDRAATVLAQESFVSGDGAQAAARRVADRFRSALTITEDEYTRFEEMKQRYSHVVVEHR